MPSVFTPSGRRSVECEDTDKSQKYTSRELSCMEGGLEALARYLSKQPDAFKNNFCRGCLNYVGRGVRNREASLVLNNVHAKEQYVQQHERGRLPSRIFPCYAFDPNRPSKLFSRPGAKVGDKVVAQYKAMKGTSVPPLLAFAEEAEAQEKEARTAVRMFTA